MSPESREFAPVKTDVFPIDLARAFEEGQQAYSNEETTIHSHRAKEDIELSPIQAGRLIGLMDLTIKSDGILGNTDDARLPQSLEMSPDEFDELLRLGEDINLFRSGVKNKSRHRFLKLRTNKAKMYIESGLLPKRLTDGIDQIAAKRVQAGNLKHIASNEKQRAKLAARTAKRQKRKEARGLKARRKPKSITKAAAGKTEQLPFAADIEQTLNSLEPGKTLTTRQIKEQVLDHNSPRKVIDGREISRTLVLLAKRGRILINQEIIDDKPTFLFEAAPVEE